MKTNILIPFLSCLLCASCSTLSSDKPAAPSNKTVTVTFVDPEKFTDVKMSSMESDKDRDFILGEIKDFIVEKAPRHMDEGQTLEVTITNIDMAGDFEPWHGARMHDIRIIKDIYPPRIDLGFKLTGADGTVVSEGARQLCDSTFMMSASLFSTNDSLRHEKQLLENWLQKDFPEKRRK